MAPEKKLRDVFNSAETSMREEGKTKNKIEQIIYYQNKKNQHTHHEKQNHNNCIEKKQQHKTQKSKRMRTLIYDHAHER